MRCARRRRKPLLFARSTSALLQSRRMPCSRSDYRFCASKRSQRSLLCLALVLHSDLKTAIFFCHFRRPCVCVRARIIDQGLMYLIRSIDSNMADLGLHITLLPIIGQALPRSAATCQNQLLVLQIGLCLFLYVFPVFEHLSVLFCSVLLFLANQLFSLFSCATSKHFILYNLLCLDLAQKVPLTGTTWIRVGHFNFG